MMHNSANISFVKHWQIIYAFLRRKLNKIRLALCRCFYSSSIGISNSRDYDQLSHYNIISDNYLICEDFRIIQTVGNTYTHPILLAKEIRVLRPLIFIYIQT